MELDDYGPAMRRLSERHRVFVLALAGQVGPPNYVRAARIAGYPIRSDGGDPSAEKQYHVIRQIAHRLMQNERILEALREIAGKRLLADTMLAANALGVIVRNPQHKDHTRAVLEVLDRAGLNAEQRIKVQHHHTDETGATMVERIRALAARLGVDEAKLLGGNAVAAPKLIDVTPGKPE
jgi:hypothetical protein